MPRWTLDHMQNAALWSPIARMVFFARELALESSTQASMFFQSPTQNRSQGRLRQRDKSRWNTLGVGCWLGTWLPWPDKYTPSPWAQAVLGRLTPGRMERSPGITQLVSRLFFAMVNCRYSLVMPYQCQAPWKSHQSQGAAVLEARCYTMEEATPCRTKITRAVVSLAPT